MSFSSYLPHEESCKTQGSRYFSVNFLLLSCNDFLPVSSERKSLKEIQPQCSKGQINNEVFVLRPILCAQHLRCVLAYVLVAGRATRQRGGFAPLSLVRNFFAPYFRVHVCTRTSRRMMEVFPPPYY